jgi:hypothetical protein
MLKENYKGFWNAAILLQSKVGLCEILRFENCADEELSVWNVTHSRLVNWHRFFVDFSDPAEGSMKLIRNVRSYIPVHVASHARKL